MLAVEVPGGLVIASIQATQAGVIVALFAGVTVLELFAGRWRKADLRQIDEWAFGGRRVGSFLTYPVAFVFLPRLWQLAHDNGYVTTSDHVLARFGSPRARWQSR